MKKLLVFFVIFLSFSWQKLLAQEEYVYSASGEILNEAYDLLKGTDTIGALNELAKIPSNDTAFIRAVADRAYLLNTMGKSEEALKVVNEALEKPGNTKLRFYLIKSTALNKLEKYDESISFLKEAIKDFPYNNSLRFNLAAAYKGKENFDKAISSYQESLYLNFYDRSTHVQLGLIYAENGYLTKAAMCLAMAQIVDPYNSTTGGLINYLEQVVEDNHDKAKDEQRFKDSEDYTELNLLLKNKVALSKGYKIKSKVSQYDLAKSLYLICERLEYDKQSDEFWQKNYIAFYKTIWEEGHFDGMFCYMLKGLNGSAKIDKLLSKNKKKMDAFANRGGGIISKNANRKNMVFNNKKQEVSFFFEDGELAAIGNYDGKPTRDWMYFHDNSEISSYGTFTNNGDKTGQWIWFHETGDTSYVINFNNKGERDGLFKEFHPNGKLSVKCTYRNKERDGLVYDYFGNGALYSTTNYKNGVKDGLQTYFYIIGTKATEVPWVDGKATGVVKRYYSTGELKSEEAYKETKLSGSATYYHVDGKLISSKGQYLDGLRTGVWEWYYTSGKLKEKGSYLKGIAIGHWEERDEQDNLLAEYDYDESGKRNGSSKTYKDGKLIREEKYSKGRLDGYKCYTMDGKLISEAQVKRGELVVNMYYENGNLRSEGVLKNDEKEGVWNFYYKNGALQSTETYVNGLIEGIDSAFYAYGALSSIYTYEKGENTGANRRFYRTGNFSSQEWQQNDELNGWYTSYRVDGTVESKTYYLDNEKQGKSYNCDLKGRPYECYVYENGFLEEYYELDTLGNVRNKTSLGFGKHQLKQYYKNGKPRIVVSYLNGKAHGDVVWYFSDGAIDVKGTYYDGSRHGKWQWFNADGSTNLVGSYIFGDRVGEWKSYDETGKLAYVGNYNLTGNREGKWVYYHPEGKASLIRYYVDGEIDGKAEYFDANGKLQYVLFYDKDLLVGYSYHDKNGKLKPMIPIKNETAKIEAYFASGKPSAIREVKWGYLNNTYTKYNSNGVVLFTAKAVNGMYEGKYLSHYANGKVYEEFNYLHDELDGPYTLYFSNGKPCVKGNYKVGEKHGQFKYYTQAGKLIRTVEYNSGVVINSF